MKIKNLYIIIIAFLLCAPYAKAQHFVAFGDNEKLTFTVGYKAKLVPNSEVAQVTMKVNKHHASDTFKITGHGKVSQFFTWFFDLNDTYKTTLDASTLRPLEANCELKEGKYHFVSKFVFDWNAMQVNSTYQNMKRANATKKTMALKNNSFDPLAIFYNVRSEDISTFKIGESRPLNLVLEDTIRTIRYKYLGKEVRHIKNKGKFNTLKFSCQLATSSGESFEDGSECFLWVSDDDNHIPLYLESPIKVGSVYAYITHYSGLRFPLDSKIE